MEFNDWIKKYYQKEDEETINKLSHAWASRPMSLKPDECCSPGDYTCQVSMPINGKVQCIDFCISHIVAALNAANIQTIASCCGHGEMTGSIIMDDGRELVVRKYDESNYNNNERTI